jgi:hypothetical protein
MKRVLLLAFVPLLLPVAALSPNFFFAKQVTLRLSYDGAVVNCEERSVSFAGIEAVRRCDPSQHPSSQPLVLVKSRSYPLGFVLFDALGLVLAVVIPKFWTAPLCVAAWRKHNGAPAKEVAEPFIKILGRAGDLAAWASKR